MLYLVWLTEGRITHEQEARYHSTVSDTGRSEQLLVYVVDYTAPSKVVTYCDRIMQVGKRQVHLPSVLVAYPGIIRQPRPRPISIKHTDDR